MAATFHNLPTPGPSAEISGGKPSTNSTFGRLDTSFSLPPAAIPGHTPDSNATTSPSPATSDSSYQPLSPPSNAKARAEKTPATRRRLSANSKESGPGRNGYTIPPPPTRARKIIQMKPQVQKDAQDKTTAATSGVKSHNTSPTLQPNGSKAGGPTATVGAKRKQAGGNITAAGRKTARKTAHSLIERRRRSKMNEEFGVLKDMIPACTGQDMHKLASKAPASCFCRLAVLM
jgi:hypothetical protein